MTTVTKLIDVLPSDFQLIKPLNEVINIAIKHVGINREDIINDSI